MILKKSYEWTIIAFKSFNLKLQDKGLVVVACFMNNKIIYFKYIYSYSHLLQLLLLQLLESIQMLQIYPCMTLCE